jgi:hypothetical protein
MGTWEKISPVQVTGLAFDDRVFEASQKRA